MTETPKGEKPSAASRYVVGLFAAGLVSLVAWAPMATEPLQAVPFESRSGQWPAVRRTHLRAFPSCAVCGSKTEPQVHHVVPFGEDPAKELDPTNLITLCRTHHFCVGHAQNWRCANPHVREDAAQMKKAIDRIKTQRRCLE